MAPNSVRQIATVAKYELLKYLRGRRLLAIVLLTIIISAIFLIVPPAIGSQYPKDPTLFTVNVLSFLGILSILSATFFGADAIVSEYESKTGYFLFPNPIRKTAIFVGKFIASALVSVGAIALYYVGSVAKFKPWFSITFANGISQYVFNNPYPTDKIFTTAAPGASGVGVQTYSLAQYYPEVRLSLIVMAVYFIVAFVLSILLAQRREM